MLQQVAAAESASRAKNQQAWAFEAVQEEEAEEEEEQEQEQEQEQERRQEEEVIVDELAKRDAPEPQRYVRDDEAPVPWGLDTLKRPIDQSHPFYALSEFGVYRRSYLQSKPPRVNFTPDLRVSPNYFRPAWRQSAPARGGSTAWRGPAPWQKLVYALVIISFCVARSRGTGTGMFSLS